MPKKFEASYISIILASATLSPMFKITQAIQVHFLILLSKFTSTIKNSQIQMNAALNDLSSWSSKCQKFNVVVSLAKKWSEVKQELEV